MTIQTRNETVSDTGGAVAGRGYLELVDGELDPPENIIMTVQAARTYYNQLRSTHLERVKLMAAVEGLIAGNPPYSPEKLARAGLSHIANVNTMDAGAMHERVALTYWNLVNQTENLAVFEIRKFTEGMDHDFQGWADILAREWTRVVKEKWEDFVNEMNVLTGQLVKFGVSPLVWSDEQDFRWSAVDLARFYCPSKTSCSPSKWDYICVETEFTVQRLYQIYLEARKNEDSPWNKEALEELLIRKANKNNKGDMIHNALDLERQIKSRAFNYAEVFSDSVTVVSLLNREFSQKISHFMFDPSGESTDFLYKLPDMYESFQEVVVTFTYTPGELYMYGSRGVGHKIFPICQIMMQVDNSMVDMARMSATPVLQTNNSPGRSLDPIRFISGVATDIGQATLQQNNLGANIPGVIQVAQYMEAKVNRNSIIGGDDPGIPDRDRGSKSAPEFQMQSIKEFGVGKQHVAHFYRIFDVVIRQMVAKMLHCKNESHPSYKIIKAWKKACTDKGVPKEIFDLPDDTEKNQLPEYLSVRAARVAGDGSNLGLIVGLNGVAGIAGGFGQKGQYNYRKDVITSRLGMDYVDRYLADSSTPDESGSGASLAHLENLVMQNGQLPQATKDNNHKVHIGTHMALLNQVIQNAQAQKMDPIEADEVFAVALPHVEEHVQFISQDPLNRAYVEQLTPIMRQVTKFAQLNRVRAQKMQQTEIRRRAQEEEQLDADMMEQRRKDLVAEREQRRQDYVAEEKMKRADQQSKTRADNMRESIEDKAENERYAIELKSRNERQKNQNVVRKPQEILADRSTEDLQNTLTGQVGTTPNPADFE